jgi:hypothetical protein
VPHLNILKVTHFSRGLENAALRRKEHQPASPVPFDFSAPLRKMGDFQQ